MFLVDKAEKLCLEGAEPQAQPSGVSGHCQQTKLYLTAPEILLYQFLRANNDQVGQAQRIIKMFYRNRIIVDLGNDTDPSKTLPTADAARVYVKACISRNGAH